MKIKIECEKCRNATDLDMMPCLYCLNTGYIKIDEDDYHCAICSSDNPCPDCLKYIIRNRIVEEES